MGFKLNPTNKFSRSVTVIQPGEKKHQQGTFEVTFNKITSTQRRKTLDEKGITGLLKIIVHSVSGVEVPDNYDPLEAVLDDEPCRNAILSKYNECVKGVERKNLSI